MTRYRAKPVEVEAVQWSGSNWHQMLAWVTSVEGSTVWTDGPHLNVEQDTNREISLDPEDYLVLDGDGDFWAWLPKEFEFHYELIEDS